MAVSGILAAAAAGVAVGAFLGYHTGHIASFLLPLSAGTVLLLLGLVILKGGSERRSGLLFNRLLLGGVGGALIVLSLGAVLGLLLAGPRTRRKRPRRLGHGRGQSA